MSAVDQEFIEETNEEKLARIGETSLITSGSGFGVTAPAAVVYPTQHAKTISRLELLNTAPSDDDGLGYQYDIAPDEV